MKQKIINIKNKKKKKKRKKKKKKNKNNNNNNNNNNIINIRYIFLSETTSGSGGVFPARMKPRLRLQAGGC